jgi:hypothetical protein
MAETIHDMRPPGAPPDGTLAEGPAHLDYPEAIDATAGTVPPAPAEQPVGAATPDAGPWNLEPQVGAAVGPSGTETAINGAENAATTQTTPEAQKDAEVRYADKELLGRSFRVRRTVQETGTQSIKTWQSVKAKVRNAFDMPGRAVKQFAYNRALKGYDRKNNRLNEATNLRLQQRRQPAVERARNRVNERSKSYAERAGRMEGRTRAVHENANRRRQEYIDELKGRRESALARKAVREQLRGDGASRRETRKIVAEIPSEHMDRVGKVALTSNTSQRKLEKATRVEKRAVRSHRRTERRIESTDTRANDYSKGIESADTVAQNIQDVHLPQAERHVFELKSRLSDVRMDEPSRAQLASELQDAEEELSSYRDELSDWQSYTEAQRQKVGDAKSKLGDLEQVRQRKEGRIATASEHVSGQRETDDLHKTQLDQTVKDVLNPEQIKEKS